LFDRYKHKTISKNLILRWCWRGAGCCVFWWWKK